MWPELREAEGLGSGDTPELPHLGDHSQHPTVPIKTLCPDLFCHITEPLPSATKGLEQILPAVYSFTLFIQRIIEYEQSTVCQLL